MKTNTGISAKSKVNTQTQILFKSKEHEDFYYKAIECCRYQDVYHKALCYCLGISADTRNNVNRIYDFKNGFVKTECIYEGWQTSGSLQIIYLAYNLYTNGTPTVDDDTHIDEQLRECRRYSVSDIFCSGNAEYFWQAIKIRYPEYVRG